MTAKRRPTGKEAAFTAVLEQCDEWEDERVSPAVCRGAACHCIDASIMGPLVPPVFASSRYVEHDSFSPPRPERQSTLEELIALELDLAPGQPHAELRRLRKEFARRNHPDRVSDACKAHALERMQIANRLIDRALGKPRS